MKNILLVIPYGSVGGIERLALNFYNAYKKNGYNVKAVKIVKLKSDIIHFGDDEIAFSESDLHTMSFVERLFFYFKAPFLLRKIIKEHNITHTVSFGDMSNVFSSLSFTSEYKVASIHALKSIEFVNKAFLNTIFKLSYRTSYTNFDKVVCISEDIKKDIVEKCNFKFVNKLNVIYNPHDVESIVEKSKETLTREEEKIFENEVVIFLGRLTCQKAPWHLIKSFSLILKEKPNCKLVIIGDGDKNVENHCLELVNKLKIKESVFFLGRKPNPYKYLVKSKLIALSSFYEGTPNVIVEAIALQIPIVSSYCTNGIKELMSLTKFKKVEELIYTESGIITPTFFKGNLEIPVDDEITNEEIQFGKAIKIVLEDVDFKNCLVQNQNQLLEKFDLDRVVQTYIEK